MLEPIIKEEVSWKITKEEIIEKFEIDVPEGYDTWSYYRDHVLEIKLFKIPVKPKKVKK